MQIDECIKSRRSVRKYSDQEINNEVLSEIVDLARFSPSWKNTQVVRYHVVKNPDTKEKIAQNCVLGFEFNAKTIVRCNALVIVSVVTGISGAMKRTAAIPPPRRIAGRCLMPASPTRPSAWLPTARALAA